MLRSIEQAKGETLVKGLNAQVRVLAGVNSTLEYCNQAESKSDCGGEGVGE